MTSRDFVYWLQGFFEITDLDSEVPIERPLTAKQVDCIRRHLNMVFYHEIDPSMGNDKHQEKLTEIHKGNKPGEQGVTYDLEQDPHDFYPVGIPSDGDILIKC